MSRRTLEKSSVKDVVAADEQRREKSDHQVSQKKSKTSVAMKRELASLIGEAFAVQVDTATVERTLDEYCSLPEVAQAVDEEHTHDTSSSTESATEQFLAIRKALESLSRSLHRPQNDSVAKKPTGARRDDGPGKHVAQPPSGHSDELEQMSLDELRRFGGDLDAALAHNSFGGFSENVRGHDGAGEIASAAGELEIGSRSTRPVPSPPPKKREAQRVDAAAPQFIACPEKSVVPATASWICDICGTANASRLSRVRGGSNHSRLRQLPPPIARVEDAEDLKCAACAFRPKTV